MSVDRSTFEQNWEQVFREQPLTDEEWHCVTLSRPILRLGWYPEQLFPSAPKRPWVEPKLVELVPKEIT